MCAQKSISSRQPPPPPPPRPLRGDPVNTYAREQNEAPAARHLTAEKYQTALDWCSLVPIDSYHMVKTIEELEPRELEVLQLMHGGKNTAETAKAMGIKAPAVKHHLKKVYAKVGTNSREQVLLQYERWLVAKGKNAA